MTLKKFLRPTRGKIIIVIVLFFLAISVGIAGGRARVATHEGDKINELKVKIFESVEMILLLPVYLVGKFIIAPKVPFSQDIIIYPISLTDTLLLFISVIFYWYLISCLIIFIYERFKEKLRKKSGSGGHVG